jgi:hypothetical protein
MRPAVAGSFRVKTRPRLCFCHPKLLQEKKKKLQQLSEDYLSPFPPPKIADGYFISVLLANFRNYLPWEEGELVW